MKAVILARVSTLRQEKEGLSLQDIQVPTLRKYAQEKGIEVVREFVFSESADRKIRTKFNEMLQFVRTNKDIEAIIAYRVDRVTRNYRDAVLIDDLRMEHQKEIHFVYDRLVINNKTTGRDITDWDTKVYLGKQVLNTLKDYAVTSAQGKLTRGEWPSKAPYGYINRKNSDGHSWIYIDEEKGPIVKKVCELYATNSYSMQQVRQEVNKMFGKKIVVSRVESILNDPFYCGTMLWDGQEYPHRYDRIISEELHDKITSIRLGRFKKPFKFAGLPFAYRGLVRCSDCGCILTPEKKTKKSGKQYVYYHCTQYKGKHKAEWLSEDALTQQFTEILGTVTLPQEALDDIVATLKDSHRDKKYFIEDLKRQYNTDYMKLENRIEKMYEDSLDGRITIDLFEKKRDQYREEQKEILAKAKNLQVADEEYYLTSQYLLQIASRAKELFESSEPNEKKQILQLTLQNLTLEGKKVRYEWKKPFDKIAIYASHPDWRG